MGIMKNYDGMRFNHFVVLKRDHKEGYRWFFLCKCDCGNEFLVDGSGLKLKKSCGCLRQEMNRQHATTHGGRYERLYKVWIGIKYRCNNPNCHEYEKYGGRGISVCPEWMDYATFRDWSYEHGYDKDAPKMECTLDRIDYNGNYEPSNCRWTDPKTQSNNRRNNRRVTIDGETKTISEWSRVSGVGKETIRNRLEHGWSEEAAVFTTPNRGNKKR